EGRGQRAGDRGQGTEGRGQRTQDGFPDDAARTGVWRMPVRNFRDLIAWQRGVDLAIEVYRVTKFFPREETYGLSSQLRRAAVSVSSNIAEGHSRRTPRDFLQFLAVARGSLAEVETQITIAARLSYIEAADGAKLTDSITELYRILNGLISSIRKRVS
ncbi:MAG: four helix bundle protein, partial [Pirellulales bacterium]